MDIETNEKTINNLPKEVLTIIFRQINFLGRLRTSLVCQQWLKVNNDDADFMGTVNLKANQRNFQQLHDAGATKLMRPYSVVTISNYVDFSPMSQIKISLLEHVTTLVFDNPDDRLDIKDLEGLWEHCKQLKKVEFSKNIFNDNNRSNYKRYMAPIELNIESPICKSVNCFNSITQLNIRSFHFLSKNSDAIIQFLVAHGQAITEMKIVDLDCLQLFNNNVHQLPLKLKSLHLDVDSFFQPCVFVEDMEQLITSQQESLVEFFMVEPTKEVFDLMRERLINLTTLKISSGFPGFQLNDLRVLANLRSLSLHVYGHTPYELDIWQLALTELDVDGRDFMKVQLQMSPNRSPMQSLRKLKLQDFLIDEKLMGDLVHCMPNLKVLSLPLCRSEEGSSDAIAAEMSRFSQLQSLVCSSKLVNDAFLSRLRLPNLHYFKLAVQYEPGERTQPEGIKRATLDALADNCPLLTRIVEKNSCFKLKIRFQRPNGSRKFRKVRYQKAMVRPLFPNLAERELDYDSVESCSDDPEEEVAPKI